MLTYRSFNSSSTTKNQFFCNFVKARIFFNLFCLSERKLRLQRLNVINKENRFKKVCYNSLNLTNLPPGDLQLNRGDCPRGNWHRLGGIARWVIVRGAIGPGRIVRGVIVQGRIFLEPKFNLNLFHTFFGYELFKLDIIFFRTTCRNQFIDLQSKLMGWVLNDRDLRHEGVHVSIRSHIKLLGVLEVCAI